MRRKYCGSIPHDFQDFIVAKTRRDGVPPTVAEIAERYNVHPHKVERAIDDARVGRRLVAGVVPGVVRDARERYRLTIAECADRYGDSFDERDIARIAGVDKALVRRWSREFGARRATPPPLDDVVEDLFLPVEIAEVSESARLLYYVLVTHEINKGEILSHPQLSQKIGLSVPWVEKLFRELKQAGLVPNERLLPGPVGSGPTEELTEEEVEQLDLWWFWYDYSGRRNPREQKVPNIRKMADVWGVSERGAKAIAHALERKGWVEINMKRRPTHGSGKRNRGSYVTLLKHPKETWRQPVSNY